MWVDDGMVSDGAGSWSASEQITVFLADDNLIVREGVRALLASESDLSIVGTASDYHELLERATAANPHVLVTDVRMPPTFQQEGIDAAKELRKRHPGTGVVVLSQYDDPEYAVALLREGAAGYAYLLKDRVAEGDHLGVAIRAVAGGGSMLDPEIVQALVAPVTSGNDLSPVEEVLLREIAEGRPIKAIAATWGAPPATVAEQVEHLFLKLAHGATAGSAPALRRLRMLHQAIVDREEQGETLSRLLPGGVAEKVVAERGRIGESERMVVTVLMSDIRGYSTIAEQADPTQLASQLNEHRAEMNRAIIGCGGTVMQFVGDAVLAVFGAPVPADDHADQALAAALAMHRAQEAVNERWSTSRLPRFGLGIGLSTGEVAAALLGSEERLEYTIVGDTVNLAQRLQQWAEAGETVLSEPTWSSLSQRVEGERLEPAPVKGRVAPVVAYRVPLHRAASPRRGVGHPEEAR
jgi:adenylate cyclase